MILSSTTAVELITGSADSIDWSVGYVDLNSATMSTTASGAGNVTTATTTTIVAAPTNQRQVKTITLRNSGTAVNNVTLQLDVSGSNRVLVSRDLSVGDSLVYTEGSGFAVFDSGISAANNVIVDGGDLTLISNASPTTPPAGDVKLFGRAIASRQMLGMIGPSGLDTALQPLLARNKVGFWCPPGNATTVPGVLGFTAYTATGTATARNVATTSMFTRMRRLGYVSAAAAGSLCGARVAVAQITMGTVISSMPVGGFFKVIRFGISDAAAVAGARMFVGISSSTGAPTNVEPSTLTNVIGVGHGAADTNLKIFYGGSAAQTPIDLGASFPLTHGSAIVYELALFNAPGVDNICYYQVTNLTDGSTASGTLTGTAGTVLPATTTLLTYTQAWRTNNATALAVGLDIFSDYIETDQ